MAQFRFVLATLAAVALCACGAADKPNTLNGNTKAQTATRPPAAGTVTPIPTPAPKAPKLRLDDRAAPVSYQATLDLLPDQKTFTGDITIDVKVNRATDQLWLHGTELRPEAMTAEVNGEQFEVKRIPSDSKQFLGLWLGRTVQPGAMRLHLRYTGKVSPENYHGIFSQKKDKLHYLYTQFESTSARRAFPCFDEPSFKVPWQVTIRTKGKNKAFSNTPELSHKTEGGWTVYRFARTKPLPAYLIAFAVGPFDVVDVGKIGRNKIPGRIIVTKGSAAKASYAVQSLPAIVGILENYFGMAYPYAKLDEIEVPHFLGAMENPGLVTYDSGILLAEKGKATTRFKRGHASVVAHELAHQWFGDLVTLAWWNDTWLNEGFATWMGAKVTNKYKPEWDVLNEAVARRNGIMVADSLKSSRAVRQPIEDADDIAASFDGISYGKGAALLWMFERWIGEARFRQGIRNYLRKYSYGTASAKNFLAEVQAVSNPAVSKAFSTFLDQPGTPLLTATVECKRNAVPKLKVSQQRFVAAGSAASTSETWHIPVCVSYGAGKVKASSCSLITKQTQTIPLDKLKGCPSWLTANADAVGYYRVAYARGMIRKLLTAGRKHLSVKERVGLIGDMNALVKANKMSIGEALSLVPTLMRDKSRHVVDSAVEIVSSVRGELIPTNMRNRFARFVRKTFGAKARRLGWKQHKNDSKQTKMLRRKLVPLVATRGADRRLANEAKRLALTWLNTRRGIDKDLVVRVLSTAGYNGDKALYDKFAAALKKEKDASMRRRLLAGMGSFRAKALVERNMKLLVSKDLNLREGRPIFSGALGRAETRGTAFAFLKKNLGKMMKKIPAFAHFYVIYAGAGFCNKAGYDDVKTFFTPKIKTINRGKKSLDQTLEQIKVCMAFKAAQQPAVIKFLRRQ